MYCAFVLCYLLDAFDSIDVDAAVAYLLRCQVRMLLLLSHYLPQYSLTIGSPPLWPLA